MIDYALLEKLCTVSGVSGDESRVRDIIINEIKAYADELKVDALGNLIVFKKGKERPNKKLLLSAHMDEVGFIITNITEQGFLKFTTVGGIDKTVMLGRYVLVGSKGLNGVIGVRPIHLLDNNDKDKPIEIEDLYIDIGAKDKDDAEKVVSLGDFASFLPNFHLNDETVKSKALDDRIGCLILIDMIKSELPYDMTFSFVVQEEIGLRGAKVAAYTVKPDAAIVVESTTAADIPNSKNKVCYLGKGAVVSFMDRATIYDKEYYGLALKTAKDEKISVQVKRAVAGGNDSGAIQSSRAGVRTLALSLPCRYLHSECSIAYKSDIQALSDLVRSLSYRLMEEK